MEQLFRIVEPRTHRAHGAIHDIGDFLMAESFDFKKCNHGTVLGRQLLHRIVQFFLKLVHKRIAISIRLIRKRINDFL